MTLLRIRMLRRKNKAILRILQIVKLMLGLRNMWKIASTFCTFLLFLLIICAASGQNIGKGFIIIAGSEASRDTFFDDVGTKRAPANDKNPVQADIIGSQTKMVASDG